MKLWFWGTRSIIFSRT